MDPSTQGAYNPSHNILFKVDNVVFTKFKVNKK